MPPIQTLFDGATQAGATDSHAQVDILDVVNDVAVIRITLENYFGADYADFHALKKGLDGWKIMSKVFTEACAPSFDTPKRSLLPAYRGGEIF